jgi:hypothetical protein
VRESKKTPEIELYPFALTETWRVSGHFLRIVSEAVTAGSNQMCTGSSIQVSSHFRGNAENHSTIMQLQPALIGGGFGRLLNKTSSD